MDAKNVYSLLCQALDSKDLKYTPHDEDLVVTLSLTAESLPICFIIHADEKRQILRITSPLNFKMPEDKRVEGALAVCAANFGDYMGNFDYDIANGSMMFRQTVSFRGCQLTQELIIDTILRCCVRIDEYSTQFLAIGKGMLSIGDFLKNA